MLIPLQVALLGLRNAISAGDVAVVVLLLWAGLRYYLDTEMLTWAFHNAEVNKVDIMNYLLAANSRGVDMLKFKCELDAERDETQRKFDQERLDFLDALEVTLEAYAGGK
jgi:hypothetical protein